MIGEGQLHAVHLLQTVTQHGTVDFLQEPMVQLDLVIGRDTNEIPVKRCVMDLAQ